MAEQVHEKVQDGVAVLILDRPPGNALAAPLRAELLDRLTTVLADELIRAVVLTGAGERFSAGIDLAELDAPPDAPRLADIAKVIEDAPKPVVAALHGSALGAGFELALAAHARVAKLGTRIALPEVTLGLLPDGGATQRLPRLVGAQAALELILSGRAFDVSNERLAKAVDRVVDDAPVAAAVEIAEGLAERGQWSRTRDRTEGLDSAAAFQAAVANAEATLRDPESVQADIVECVEAAHLLPFDQGLRFETARFQDRCRSPRARGIRHSFVAERRAATLPVDVSNSAQRPETAVVFGTSPIVAELAAMALALGLKVCVECGDARQTEAMVSRVRVLLSKGLADGKFAAPEHDAMLARLQAARNGNELDEADLVFDTANLTPTPSVEQKPGAVWILVSDKVSAAERAGEVASKVQIASVRVQRPAHLASLWELSAPDTTSRAALATAHRVLSKAGRSVIWTPDLPFGVSDAIVSTMFRVALVMLAAGFKPDRIDAAAQSLGFAQGPLKTIDDAGAARCLERMKQIFEAREVNRRPLRLLSDRLSDVTEGGSLPVDSALVFHLAAGRRPEFDPGLRSWVAEWRNENPDRSVLWPGGTLETALHAALVNEAARLIATKTVQRASDFDLVAVKAAGFDRDKGGPLLQADMAGLLGLLRAMARLEEIDADLWQPHPLLPEMVKNGRHFF